MMKRFFFSAILALSFLGSAIAQNGTIRGNVYDKDSGEPVIYCNVLISGTGKGATTDLDGFFTITDVAPGDITLVSTYIGYDSVAVDVKLRAGGLEYVSMYMTESGVQLGVVNVSAKKEQARSDVQISKVTVTPKQIRALPSVGGEADIAQYLPVLPGVIVTGDQGGQLYIRGGSPVQNKILLDGMTIYNPFHSIGFFSVFETETIKNVDVLTGGFGAEYGGRISAVVDIKTKEGDKKKFGGVVSASPFQAKVLVEGPIKKLKEEGGGSTSFLLTGKKSYLDQTSKALYSYASSDSLGLPFSFQDVYGKVSMVAGNGSKLNLFGFNFTDGVNYPGIANLNWVTNGAAANFNLIPPASSFTITGTFAFSNYNIKLQEADGAPRTSGINTYSAGLNFLNFGKNSELKYGFEFNGFNTDFIFRNFLNLTFQQEDFTTELAGYATYKRKIGNLIIEPSVRLHYYASLNEPSFEPRLGVKYNITEGIRFKFAGGLYSQNLISTVNERDVVNLFVGFLSGPEETFFKPGTTEPTDHRLQKAMHAIAGMEFDVGDNTTLNVEPYYKGFNQIIQINRNKVLPSDPNYVTETGEAYGIDFSVDYQVPSLTVWATYSLGFVNRDDGEQVYPTLFDRRHNVNFLVSHTFGGDRDWEASARWNMGSGFPFTRTQGFYGNSIFADGLDSDPLTENAELGIVYSEERNGGRLPYYHRLDFSLKKTFTFSKSSKLEAIASLTNAYNRDNIFYFDRVRYERVNQLPILPSIGLTFHF